MMVRSGNSLGKGRELRQLGEADPGVEGETHPREHTRAGAVRGRREDPLLFPVADLGMRVPRHSPRQNILALPRFW